jgi:hypothetical protein
MKGLRSKAFVFVVIIGISLAVISSFAIAQKKEDVVAQYYGNVIQWSGPGSGRTARLTMRIERWSTDEERMHLYNTLVEGGEEALLKEMKEKIVGYIWFTGTTRWQLNIASTGKTEKGVLVRLVTARPLGFGEVARSMRTLENQFGVIEFTIDESGRGTGYIIPMAKIQINKEGKLEVETFGTTPQKLTNVKQEK